MSHIDFMLVEKEHRGKGLVPSFYGQHLRELKRGVLLKYMWTQYSSKPQNSIANTALRTTGHIWN